MSCASLGELGGGSGIGRLFRSGTDEAGGVDGCSHRVAFHVSGPVTFVAELAGGDVGAFGTREVGVSVVVPNCRPMYFASYILFLMPKSLSCVIQRTISACLLMSCRMCSASVGLLSVHRGQVSLCWPSSG